MQIRNVKFYKNIDWETYINMPGKSFSWLKNEGAGIGESEGIRIGKLVHTYLLKPTEYNYEQADIVIPIARVLVEHYNTIIKWAECETGATADFIVDGLLMPYRGMADMNIFKHLVVDFKVLGNDLKYAMERFMYKDQIRGYMLPFEAPLGLIIAYNKKTKKVQTESVGQDIRWWTYKVKQYGNICN